MTTNEAGPLGSECNAELGLAPKRDVLAVVAEWALAGHITELGVTGNACEAIRAAVAREVAAELERSLAALTRHDWRPANIWRHYYPSATGDWVDLREMRKVLGLNV